MSQVRPLSPHAVVEQCITSMEKSLELELNTARVRFIDNLKRNVVDTITYETREIVKREYLWQMMIRLRQDVEAAPTTQDLYQHAVERVAAKRRELFALQLAYVAKDTGKLIARLLQEEETRARLEFLEILKTISIRLEQCQRAVELWRQQQNTTTTS